MRYAPCVHLGLKKPFGQYKRGVVFSRSSYAMAGKIDYDVYIA
jgi:hypothetical protein